MRSSPVKVSQDASEYGKHDSQVAYSGHDETLLMSASGEVVIKPCLPLERAFYESLGPSLAFDFIGRWTPHTYGTLRLEGKVRAGQEADVSAVPPQALAAEAGSVSKALDLETVPADANKDALVMENLTHPFLRANVLDIKLGTQLWDEDSSPEKRVRMEKASADTTSGTHGIRLTGFRVWNANNGEYDVTPKAYGKSIKAADLPDGLRRIFPAQHDDGSGPGLPTSLLRDLLRLILARFRILRGLVQDFEWRVRGGSVLIVYEGDAEKLREVLPNSRAAPEEEDTDEEDDDDDEGSSDEDEPLKTKAFDLRLIDFAHARPAKGKGSDEGYNLGLRTTEELLAGRLAELEGM